MLSNAILMVSNYSIEVNLLNIFKYVLWKGFGANISLSSRDESTTTSWSMASCSKFFLDLMVPDSYNPNLCSMCRYPDAWSTKMHPPTYCSEYDNTNEVIVGLFKLDSKWSTNTQSPGWVYDALRAPSASVLLIWLYSFVVFMLEFTYSHVSHLYISHFAVAVNFGEVNGWTWQNICWMGCMLLWPNFWCHGIRIFEEGVKLVFSLERTYRLTSVPEYVLVSLQERVTWRYDMESYGIWRDEVQYYVQFSTELDEWTSQWQRHSKILGGSSS